MQRHLLFLRSSFPFMCSVLLLERFLFFLFSVRVWHPVVIALLFLKRQTHW